MRFTKKEIEALRLNFAAQLFTGAVLLSQTQEGKILDFNEAASDALDLYDALLEEIEADEAEDEDQ